MRSLEDVKSKRSELKKELEGFERVARGYATLSKDERLNLRGVERAEHHYIHMCIFNLKSQINCLSFVLNEDTELYDLTVARGKHRELGITKDSVFKDSETK